MVLDGREPAAGRRGGDRLALDAFKVPHHGSRANLSSPLLLTLDCKRHLFSSNGSKTKPPAPGGASRERSPRPGPGSTLFFNYSTTFNEPWADDELEDEHEYDAVFPEQAGAGLSVTLGED